MSVLRIFILIKYNNTFCVLETCYNNLFFPWKISIKLDNKKEERNKLIKILVNKIQKYFNRIKIFI